MMKVITLIFCAITLSLASVVSAQSDSAAAKPKFQMMQYQMVLISKGQTVHDSATSKKLGQGHMANIEKMAKMGKLVLAGPFGDKGELRGIFIMDVATKEEAERLCQDDPAIAAGALKIEIKPWWGPKGLTYFGKEQLLNE
jgi:uncharacterized protein YciI